MSLTGTPDVSARSMLRHSQSLKFLMECRSPGTLDIAAKSMFRDSMFLGSSSVPMSDIPWGASNFFCVEALTSLKHQVCRRATFPVNLKLCLCQNVDLSETSGVPASGIPWGTSYFNCIEVLILLKHQMCQRATLPEEPQTLIVSKHWPCGSIKCANERHSLRIRGTTIFYSVEALTSLKHPVCRQATFPEEPQASTVSKHWPRWNINCAVERHSLRNLNLWLYWSIDLTETLDVSARSKLQHSQSSRFLSVYRLPAHLMLQRGQCFDRVKVCGFSGNVARRHTWWFSTFSALTQSMFDVPQGMSLAGTLDVSVRSMLWHNQSLRFRRECRVPAHLMVKRGQCLNVSKVWESSRNVSRRHT